MKRRNVTRVFHIFSSLLKQYNCWTIWLCSLYITISSDNPIISHNRIYCNRKADIRDMYAKNAATLNECGIDAYFPILGSVCSLDDAMNTEIAGIYSTARFSRNGLRFAPRSLASTRAIRTPNNVWKSKINRKLYRIWYLQLVPDRVVKRFVWQRRVFWKPFTTAPKYAIILYI